MYSVYCQKYCVLYNIMDGCEVIRRMFQTITRFWGLKKIETGYPKSYDYL